MGYEIRKESITDKLEQLKPLIEQHHHEVMISFHNPSVSDKQYEALEALGLLHGLFCYKGEQIIGYCTFVLSPNIHYQTLGVAQVTALYVAPEHRGRLGLKLIAQTEDLAKALGADSILWGVPVNSRAAHIFERNGYRAQDISFVRDL